MAPSTPVGLLGIETSATVAFDQKEVGRIRIKPKLTLQHSGIWPGSGSARGHGYYARRKFNLFCRAASCDGAKDKALYVKVERPASKALGKMEVTASVIKQDPPLRGLLSTSPNTWVGLGVAAALVAAAVTWLLQMRGSKRPVDSLARRGLLSADRLEDFAVIQEYDNPTEVRSYQVGNVELRELGYLAPLSEEKRRQHREARMAEHGWKKLEVVLVEGDPIPEGVDEKAVRFIPRKHPFAMSQDEMEEEWSEEVVKRRLSQRRGLPEKDKLEAKKRLEMYRQEERRGGQGAEGRSRGEGRSGLVEQSWRDRGREGGNGNIPTKGSGDSGKNSSGPVGASYTRAGVRVESDAVGMAYRGAVGTAADGNGMPGSRGTEVGQDSMWGPGNEIGNVDLGSNGGLSQGSELDAGRSGGRRTAQTSDPGSAFGWSPEFLPPACDEEGTAQLQREVRSIQGKGPQSATSEESPS